jgi:hypothetical protein
MRSIFVVEASVLDATMKEMDDGELEYGVYEQFEQDIGCKTGPIWSLALPEQRASGRVHASHVA